MQRLLAILLFAAFLLPVAAPALSLGQDADAGLPACCRRHGIHHCAMSMGMAQAAQTQEDRQPHWQTKHERCPYCVTMPARAHADPLAAPSREAVVLTAYSHPVGAVQSECRRRIARDRSRQKRGPPSISLA